MMKYSVAAVAALVALTKLTTSEVIFKEDFNDNEWSDRWVVSEWKPSSEIGKWEHTAGNWHADKSDKGIKTSEDARFYGISAKMPKPFDSEGKDLVIQFMVKHEQTIDCGGAYIKLLPAGLDQKKFGGDSPYAIMFGPDICGSTKKTHAILNYARPSGDIEAKNMDHKGEISAESDEHAHLYTFIIKKDNTYEVKIDGESKSSGKLSENWPFQPEKEIKDPSKSKPTDWIDEAKIVDPDDKKPDGYDDIPKTIPDAEAKKPEDWDDEDDGEWEAPMIDNPDYKGPWSPKMIDNPAYKGEWEHPVVPNPDYFEDDKMYAVCKGCEYVGFELWQVKSGTLFDDILITDSIEDAKDAEKEALSKIASLKLKKEEQEKEKEEKEKEEKEKKEKEVKKEELEEDKKEVEEDNKDDDDDDDNTKDEL